MSRNLAIPLVKAKSQSMVTFCGKCQNDQLFKFHGKMDGWRNVAIYVCQACGAGIERRADD